jgi:hypothetical protein
MKKYLLAFLFASITCMAVAQSEKYMSTMQETVNAIGPAFANPVELLSLANKFERIANAEKNQWLPYYYAAYCQVNYGYMSPDKSKTDEIANKATELIDKAAVLEPNNSEISCIKSMIASCHLMVDPMNRYMEYVPESQKNLEAAMQQDPTNPRPEMLIGQGLKYTPEQFGGGCRNALEKLEAAAKKFESFKPVSALHPNWGKEYNQKVIDECKK